VSLLALSLAVSVASAFDGNDRLELELSSGEEVVGWHYAAKDGVLVLSGQNRFFEVPTVLVAQVRLDGQPLALSDFHTAIARDQLELSALRAAPPPLPSPAAVTVASLLWAGSGHAALGDWGTAWGYLAVESVLWGTAAYTIFANGNLPILIPLAGVDLIFRWVAAGDASRRARSRHRQLQVGPPVLPSR